FVEVSVCGEALERIVVEVLRYLDVRVYPFAHGALLRRVVELQTVELRQELFDLAALVAQAQIHRRQHNPARPRLDARAYARLCVETAEREAQVEQRARHRGEPSLVRARVEAHPPDLARAHHPEPEDEPDEQSEADAERHERAPERVAPGRRRPRARAPRLAARRLARPAVDDPPLFALLVAHTQEFKVASS